MELRGAEGTRVSNRRFLCASTSPFLKKRIDTKKKSTKHSIEGERGEGGRGGTNSGEGEVKRNIVKLILSGLH